jgi:uncharacterized protein YrzB (UPF0473 family)
MKQTAVEWLGNELDIILPEMYPSEWDKFEIAIQQAKEMEKEQIRTILLAYNEERNDRTDGAENYWEPYEVDDFLEEYNETFKANEK